MFTGIIKELGVVRRFAKVASLYRLEIESKKIFGNVEIGSSVSVNGVCLTLVKKDNNILSFDIMDQTLRNTNLTRLKNKDLVNLEDSLRTGGELAGHFVLGHVDCTGKITDRAKYGGDLSIEAEIPGRFAHLLVKKGSVALDGVSLTVGELKENRFRVYLVPHTLGQTTLGSKSISDELNLEFDIIGKYIARQKEMSRSHNITEEFLRQKGFI